MNLVAESILSVSRNREGLDKGLLLNAENRSETVFSQLPTTRRSNDFNGSATFEYGYFKKLFAQFLSCESRKEKSSEEP